jgi:hypothetical protein
MEKRKKFRNEKKSRVKKRNETKKIRNSLGDVKAEGLTLNPFLCKTEQPFRRRAFRGD